MKKLEFNEGWKWKKGSGSALSSIYSITDTSKEVVLPHDAVVLQPRNETCEHGAQTGFYDSFNMFYTKSVFFSERDADKTIMIEFGGVYMNAFVYVNKALAGKCAYGYSEFIVDITPYINFGEKNEIKVVLRGGDTNARWYTGGGIYRPVHLLTGSKLYIKPRGVKITTEKTGNGVATLLVDVDIQNSEYRNKHIKVITSIEKDGSLIAEHTSYSQIERGNKVIVHQRITVKNPILWNVDTPELYDYNVKVLSCGEECDAETGSFGIRKLALDSVNGLQLNGESVKLRGGCIHHDHGIIGAAEFYSAAERKVKRLKDAGFNAIRSAHNPLSEEMLLACDRIGMLVMDEFSDTWTSTKVDFDYGIRFVDDWEKDVKSMVEKDYNHPCVILYSTGNEIPEASNDADSFYGYKIAQLIRELDNSRFTISGVNPTFAAFDLIEKYKNDLMEQPLEINTAMNKLGAKLQEIQAMPEIDKSLRETFSYTDIYGYNYATEKYVPTLEKNPDAVIIGSETYHRDLYRNWEIIKHHAAVIGDFCWTAYDYLGESGIGIVKYDKSKANELYSTSYCLSAGCGDLDLIGNRRAVSYWKQVVWGLCKEPQIVAYKPWNYGKEAIHTKWSWTDALKSWTFPGYENKRIQVEVYSDAEEIELDLNGESVGRQKVGETVPLTALFDIKYVPGELKAIAYKKGVKISESALKTAASVSVVATLSKKEIPVNDIAFIDIKIADSKGIVNHCDNRKIKVVVDGPGVLQGIGNADPYLKTDFFSDECETYEGRLLIAVRAVSRGTIQVHIMENKKEVANSVISAY